MYDVFAKNIPLHIRTHIHIVTLLAMVTISSEELEEYQKIESENIIPV